MIVIRVLQYTPIRIECLSSVSHGETIVFLCLNYFASATTVSCLQCDLNRTQESVFVCHKFVFTRHEAR